MAVMGGKAVNGWRFWSLEAEVQTGEAAGAAEKPAEAPKAAKPKAAKARKLIYKVPNQQGTPAGKQKYFCTACMNSFLADEGERPEVCPEGHSTSDPKFIENEAGAAADVEA